MSTPSDFPGSCVTNTHILHDFAEIAYIVCTHAIPASTDSATNANSPDEILDRLRNAEKQFRQHSILVALDAEKLELFTFYRKVDVVKDQRTILNKFGYVCRLNSCIISAKSATRVLELLKPESSRIYRLFTSAILSSIQILPKTSKSSLRIGSRVYLVPTVEEDGTQVGRVAAFCPGWQIHRVNLQVVATGQLVMTVQNARNALLNLLFDLEQERGVSSLPSDTLAYLAPTGQIARISGSLSGTKSELSEIVKTGSPRQHDAKIALTQIASTHEWLKHDYPSFITDLGDDDRWFQVEIAVFETKDESNLPSDRTLVWKPLMWPSKLIYVFQRTGDFRNVSRQSAVEVDPLRFMLDWYNSSAERSGQMARAQAVRDLKDDTDDDHVFVDEGHFEDNFNPQVFGPPAFPASQMVYPTPPEVGIAHQTPGMSSVDGLAPTPAPILNIGQADSESFLDQEMPDIGDQPPDRIGTGFYDEDLFEEMPDDKFAPNTEADEPNWDFFDPPDFEPSDSVAVKAEFSNHNQEMPSADLGSNTGLAMTKEEDEFPVLESPVQDKRNEAILQDVDLTGTSLDKIDSIYANDLTISPTATNQNEYVGNSLSHLSEPPTATSVQPQDELYGQNFDHPASRRRSSVFEGVIALHTGHSGHDSRYGKHGKFWFSDEPVQGLKRMPLAYSHRSKRPSSSGSNSSTASSVSDSNASSQQAMEEFTSNKRTWTEYNPESPAIELTQSNDVDQEQIKTDNDILLTIVGTNSGEDPFLLQIEPFGNYRKRASYSAQKSLMIAQILVDQVSQSSLLRHARNMQLHHRENHLQVNISMDHSGTKAIIDHATLSELSSIPPRTSARVISLKSRLICVHRVDTEIAARPSILPFWDILGLQPYNQHKNVTAFCIFQNSNNVAEGCAAFLSRLADSYMSCNLGTHSTGRIAGVTNDGLLSWTPQASPGPNLKQLCQRLGSAIGSSNTTTGDTVIVYMISPHKDSASYREMCHAFMILFDAFIDTSEGLKRNVELALQIVPLDFIASAETLAIPSQDAYLELALEIYNRVPVRQADAAVASCGSAVILDKHQIRDPAFELSNTIISPLCKDGPCLHLAYSYSLDKRWLTVAWSDERGLIAFTMSYCLSAVAGGQAHPKREVFRSIWDTSHDVMSRSRVKWRLVVAYPGFYEAEDVAEWQHLISQGGEERKAISRLLLLSIDLNPDIFVDVPNVPAKVIQQAPISHITNISGTPVSTPQANITSPDQIVAATPSSGTMAQVNAASPPEHSLESGQDHETTLIDPTDQSWAILLAYGLNQSFNFLEVRPAAASGLLVKKTGSRDEAKALRLLGVNLVAVPRSPPTSLSLSERETILQEIMEQYRGLVTLAISRGCIDRCLDCVPWHVATSVKGSRVLGEAM